VHKVLKAVLAVVASLVIAVATMSAQTAAPGDWPHVNRGAGSSRSVSLDEINPGTGGAVRTFALPR
jgi:hypothetical protein